MPQWTGLLFSKVHAADYTEWCASGGHAQGKSRVLTGLANSGRRRRRRPAPSPQRTQRHTTWLLRKWIQRGFLGDADKFHSARPEPVLWLALKRGLVWEVSSTQFQFGGHFCWECAALHGCCSTCKRPAAPSATQLSGSPYKVVVHHQAQNRQPQAALTMRSTQCSWATSPWANHKCNHHQLQP